MQTDAQIQQAVLAELTWDSRVEATDIGVAVDHAVVTLTGTVASYAERLAAREAAHRVAGVRDVADDIAVHVSSRDGKTDTEIAQAVRGVLAWDVQVPHERISSTVADGWVTLEGTVPLGHQRAAAERAVRNLAGVRGVRDRIAVAGPALATERVRAEIEAALERRAAREARRIEVAVRDGTATLSGTVRSWAEREAVVGAARFTPGVRHLVDHLRIVATE